MSEAGMRGRLTNALRSLHAIAVENPIHPGTPDINYSEGWIEAKWLRAWPRRPETVVTVDHFTKQQKLWLRQRSRAGGAAWLILQCRTEWLVFDGNTAAEILGQVPRAELEARALVIWHKLNEKELLKWISNPTRNSSSPVVAPERPSPPPPHGSGCR